MPAVAVAARDAGFKRADRSDFAEQYRIELLGFGQLKAEHRGAKERIEPTELEGGFGQGLGHGVRV